MKGNYFMLELYLPLLGDISITSQDEKLIAFSERQFTRFKKSNYSKTNKNINEYLRINTKRSADIIRTDQILSRRHKVIDGVLKFSIKMRSHTILYRYSQVNGFLDVNTTLKKSMLLTLKRLMGSEYRVVHTLFYRLVLYPIFSLYALNGFHILHGSALRRRDCLTANLIVGFDGVGKSSLTSQLLKKGYALLSDNFIISNGKEVIPLIMPIRTAEPIENFELLYTAKTHYESLPAEQSDGEKYKPILLSDIALIKIGKGKINVEQRNVSLSTIVQISNGADEISEANIFCAPFHFLGGEAVGSYNHFNVAIYSIPYGEIAEGAERFR